MSPRRCSRRARGRTVVFAIQHAPATLNGPKSLADILHRVKERKSAPRDQLELSDDDVDLIEGVIAVKRGKNGKARFVPIAPSTIDKLRAYCAQRKRLLGATIGAFFRMDDGRRLTDSCARYNFARVSQKMGLRKPQRFCRHGRGPRIHDLRHTFAVRTIVGWYRKGIDPDREMIKLSTYLGHENPNHTYWYIEAVPELLQLASKRAERSLAGGRNR
jgi:integrase/recombinase XerD